MDGSVIATFRKCGVDLASASVPLFINVPNPFAIRFNISETLMTPTRDGASHPPFEKPIFSPFLLTVYYDDGSQVEGSKVLRLRPQTLREFARDESHQGRDQVYEYDRGLPRMPKDKPL